MLGLLMALVLFLAATPAAEPSPHLEPFKPFLGKTWKGLVNPEQGVHDVARWELALNGQVVPLIRFHPLRKAITFNSLRRAKSLEARRQGDGSSYSDAVFLC